ncbi:response regulator transcription factor, partial [Streptomyces sp. NPDC057067]|uniref:response regulator transcription factor n=1 Tax=Streptomyces sp. NPDC057067 TaxID=3346013 RepID=UPI00362A3605
GGDCGGAGRRRTCGMARARSPPGGPAPPRPPASGEALVSPAITVRLLRRLTSTVPAPKEPHTALSAREKDLVRLVARGLTNAEIAAELSISVGTVKTHLGNVQTKLTARNRVEIAAWAWESGLVDGRG